MNSYVTGAAIRQLREERKMTQLDLARQLSVSSKTVSKRSFPRIQRKMSGSSRCWTVA